MLPIPLSLSGPQLGLWSDVLWRYPQTPSSPLAELKTQLPPQLHPDPRLWSREDVNVFLRFCEREFDLPKFELDLFQMNGKALCLLTRTDFGERCPGAGDVLHNVLQMLIRESQMMQRHLPSSPVTPTSRYPLSPHSHPPTPNWASLVPPDNPFHSAHLHHFIQPNSVTLSPAPSIDSQASSPPQNQLDVNNSNNSNGVGSSISSNGSNSNNQNVFNNMNHHHHHQNNHHNNANSSSSNQSDSDEDSFTETKPQLQNVSPPTTPILKDIKPCLSSQQITNITNSWSNNHNGGNNNSSSNISLKTEGNSSSGPGSNSNNGEDGSTSLPTPGTFAS